MGVGSRITGRRVWIASLGWRDRRRLWRQGGRRVHRGWPRYDDIAPALAAHGVDIVPYRIDVAAFWRYVADCGYRDMSYWDGGRARAGTEKWLEHFVSIDLMQPRSGEVHIDIASSYSPIPDILRERTGCTTYRQDRLYPAGVQGDRIGSDAVELPVSSASVDGLTLHCSFEHFEGDRDVRFLREASRVLRPGGRLCILPFYLSHTYCIQTDLAAWSGDPPRFESDAVICASEGWGEVHGRFYDPAHFADRILANLGALRLTVYRVQNYEDVAPDCYLKFAAVFTRT